MNLIWDKTKTSLVDQYCTVAQDALLRRYQSANILVLPRLIPHTNTVYLPPLNLPETWWCQIADQTPRHHGQSWPVSIRMPVSKKLNKTNQEIPSKNTFNQIWPQVITKLKSLPPCKQFWSKEIQSLRIVPTWFGTRGSFRFDPVSKQVFLSLRSDFDQSSLLRVGLKLAYSFEYGASEIDQPASKKRQAAIEYALRLLDIPKSDLDSSEYRHESDTYLQKLGLELSWIWCTDGQIVVKGHSISRIFTPTEEKLLSLLFTNQGQVVSYDAIADAIWQDKADDKFSLQVIAKHVQQIRDKLAQVGLKGNLVSTIKSRGYAIKNNCIS